MNLDFAVSSFQVLPRYLFSPYFFVLGSVGHFDVAPGCLTLSVIQASPEGFLPTSN